MNQPAGEAVINIFEQISQICREFRKLLAQGQIPQIEQYLTKVPDGDKENLFSNLLECEINFRQRRGEHPTSDDYVHRFRQFSSLIRRAFFEPTMASVDSSRSALDDGHADPSRLTVTLQLPDANRLGEYELLRELGRGGMEVVYEARHTKTGNRLALKTLPTRHDGQELKADRLHRFRKEFRSLSEINHPKRSSFFGTRLSSVSWSLRACGSHFVSHGFRESRTR